MRKKAKRRKAPVLTALFGALSNQTRIDILLILCDGERNVSQLAKALRIRQPLISHNLRKLTSVGFLRMRKQGNYRYYDLERELAEPFLLAVDSCMKIV